MALRAALARTRLGTSIVRAPISKPAPLRAGTHRYYSAGAQQPNSGKPSFAAMAAVASLGFAAYYTLVKSREGQPLPRKQKIPAEKPEQPKEPQLPNLEDRKVPTFDKKDVTVVFVLGGPGAGKGTQCAKIKEDYDFVHLSAGDLLREEQQREGSQYGELIKNYIKDGLIVPMEVTIVLLENAMRDAIEKQKKTRFLIDGFPRKLDQAVKFEEVVVPCQFVLYFECPEEVLLKRLLKRGESSGRIDDNIESIKKRFRVFADTSFPVIEEYEKEGKVKKLSCENTVDGVYDEVKKIFTDLLKQ
ncbi:adenylate kinase-domain-containing protein [Umbelopsis sp. PMI_123]|nr:adenylate kinase-domain-containing protein [Umbelopsis sp. PMI_123]